VTRVRAQTQTTSQLAARVMSCADVVRVALMERFPSTAVAVFCVTVPETVRLWNPFEAYRVLRVLAAPDRVTVLEPFVNVAPTPDVSQLPLTVQAPLVSVMVPEVLPFTVTSAAETVDAFATRIPESSTAMDPPVKERFAVASVVVDPAPS